MIPEIIETVASNISKQMYEEIKRRLIKNGFDPNDIEFLKTRVTRIVQEGSGAEEFYVDHNTKNQIRIITILPFDPMEERDGTYLVTRKYY